MDYTRRIIDEQLDDLFPHLPAIALEGARGVGKTATASRRGASMVNLANPRQRSIVEVDPGYVATLARPTFLDEWQLVPETWDIVKMNVDMNPSGGQFLLAGSAGVKRGVRIHSGAGRIVKLAMRPMSLPERGLCDPTVSLTALMNGNSDVEGSCDLRLSDYTDEILASGFPAIRTLPERARRLQLDSYLQRVVDHDLVENGVVVRRPAALTSWLTAYAAATGTTTSYSNILDAATPGEDQKPARQTVAVYREELIRLFILDSLPAWIPAMSPLKKLSQSPKHHLVDPGLAARLIGSTKSSLLRGEGRTLSAPDSTALGALFESLATQTVRILAEAVEANTFHMRTQDGLHEIDLIVEAPDRRVLALEVKLSDKVDDRDVKHLLWLSSLLGDRVIDTVVLTTGPIAYRRQDGVAVVPLGLLGL